MDNNNQLYWSKWDASQDLEIFPDIRYQCPICFNSVKEPYSECPHCHARLKNVTNLKIFY